MAKIILILISISVIFFIGCSEEEPIYIPEVVYLKAPEMVTVNNKELLRVEFAVADLRNRIGEITISLDGKDTILKDRYFSPEGSIFVVDLDQKVNSKFDLTFNIKTKNDNSETVFPNVKLNSSIATDNFNVNVIFYKKDNSKDRLFKTNKAKLILSDNTIIPKNGKIILPSIKSKRYNIRVEESKEQKDGFYRSIALDSVLLDKETTLYFTIIHADNKIYNDPLINCSYNNRSNRFYIFIMILFSFIFFIRKKSN